MATHPFDWATWGRIDATELAAKLQAKDVTMSEVMHQFADAISLQNPHLNAVIEVFNDVLDDPDSTGANPDGAFYGVPIMIKDMGSRIKGREKHSHAKNWTGFKRGHELKARPLHSKSTPKFSHTLADGIPRKSK